VVVDVVEVVVVEEVVVVAYSVAYQ